MSFMKYTKKIIAVVASILILSVFIPSVRAQAAMDISVILSAIKEDTGNILITVNSLPSHIDAIAQELVAFYMAFNKADSDKDSPSVTLQADFSTLYNINNADNDTRTSIQARLVSAYLVSNFATKDSSGNPIIDKNGNYSVAPVANVNDIVYQSLLGIPISVTSNANTANDVNFNFVRNASGITSNHTTPQTNWRGTPQNIINYRSYFNSVNAIQTYNGYVLSRIYADLSQGEGGTLSAQQAKLMEDASSSSWFTKVASEDIGIVLRQILMYNSQIFVLMTQILQVQREQLAVATMTNTLFIWANNYTENQLLDRAQK